MLKKKIESEKIAICKDLIVLLNEKFVSTATTREAQVFYLKMRGDYYRYLAETEDRAGHYAKLSEKVYL